MRLSSFWRRQRQPEAAHLLYVRLVAQARRPEFYRDLEVPDSLDGRFDMIALHAFLLLRRLKDAGAEGRILAQAVFDALFDDMDNALREMGVADLGVGKRIKAMAKGLYGRIDAYERGLAAGEAATGEALRRNLYGTVAPSPAVLAAMAGYLRREAEALESAENSDIFAAKWHFGAPPAPVAGTKSV